MSTIFIILIFMSYITLGLPDSAYGTALPFLRPELGISHTMASAFAVIVTVCSALSAAVMPRLTKNTNTGALLAFCSMVSGAAILIISFVTDFYALCLLAVPLGIAGGGVDVSINNYVSEHYRSSVMNLVHAAWGFGAFIGPLIITYSIDSFSSWRMGFQILSVIQLAFALILYMTMKLWGSRYEPKKLVFTEDSSEHSVTLTKGKRAFAILLCVASFFVYCGAENSMGQWLNSLLTEGRGFGNVGGTCVSVYFCSIMAGRVITGLFSNRLGNRKCIWIGVAVALTGAGLFFIQDRIMAYVSVALIGLGFAPIYPCLMHETAMRFDSQTAKKVVGYQVSMACVGMLSMAPLVGYLMENISLEMLPVMIIGLSVLLGAVILTLNLITPKKRVNKAI